MERESSHTEGKQDVSYGSKTGNKNSFGVEIGNYSTAVFIQASFNIVMVRLSHKNIFPNSSFKHIIWIRTVILRVLKTISWTTFTMNFFNWAFISIIIFIKIFVWTSESF